MSNEMISVPRDLLAIAEKFISAQASNFPKINRGQSSRALNELSEELRALLAKPAELSEQHLGYSVVARVCAYTPGMGQIELKLPGNLPSWLEMGETVTVRHGNAQHQGEPVDWVVVSPEGMEPVKGLAYTKECADRYVAAGWSVTPVYTRPAEQPWPTVRVHADDSMAVTQKPSSYADVPFKQPAPVAVVLPRRRISRAENPAARISHSQGWNACLDEVARLNPPQQ